MTGLGPFEGVRMLAALRRPPAAVSAPAEQAGPAWLTDPEHRALALLAQLWDVIAGEILPPGPAGVPDDAQELAGHVHALQRAVLAQAAGRAYPSRYRLLGRTLPAAEAGPAYGGPPRQPDGRHRSG